MCIYYSQQTLKRILCVKPYSLSFVVLLCLPFSFALNAAETIPTHMNKNLNATQNFKNSLLSNAKNLTESEEEIQHQQLTSNSGAETFLVEIIINAQRLPDIYRVEKLTDGRIALPLDTWAFTRLLPAQDIIELPDANRGYILDLIQGLNYRLDRKTQTLEINAPAEAFQGNVLDTRPQKAVLPNSTSSGVLINYNISAVRTAQNKTSYGSFVEGIAFNNGGSTVVSAVLRKDEYETEVIRTETYWQKDLPDQMQFFVLGDTIDSGSDWSRPARFAGIRWGRNFSLQPEYISYPMPSISGSAALPSTIDVLVNNQKSQTQTVNSGPFDLKNIPVVTGAGELNLVVRNLLGEQTVITRSYYTSPQLLEKGITDFSFQAGFLRENYGTVSNDYGSFFSSANWRQGLSGTTTVEGRLELQEDRQAIGGMIDHVLADFAVARLGGGISSDKNSQGGHYLIGLEHTGVRGGGSVRWEYFDNNYNQFASIDGEVKPQQRISIGYGLPIFRHISAGINYTSQSTWNGDLFRLFSTSLSFSLPENMFLNTYASKGLDSDQGWNSGFSLTIPLGKQRSVSAHMVQDNNGHSSTAELTQSVPVGPGIGWSVRASDHPDQKIRTNLTWNTNSGQFIAEAAEDSNTDLSLRFAANGSIGWFKQLAFATQNIGHGSFAVVKVADFEGIPVYHSNQLAAYTNSKGLAFVPNLLPYQKNKISLDPTELPLDAEIGGIEEYSQPYARSGTFVSLPIRRSYNVFITLRQPDHSPVPLGARIKLVGRDNEFMVGKRGEAYLMDLAKSNRIIVTWETGQCELDLPVDLNDSNESEIVPLICGSSK